VLVDWHWPLAVQVSVPGQVPQEPPQVSLPHCFPPHWGEQATHWPCALQLLPPEHVPQEPPQLSSPHCFPVHWGEQATHWPWALQVVVPEQVPQEPPQVSLPHCSPEHCGTQVPVQVPLVQAWPLPQTLHAEPAAPQAETVFEGVMQVPFGAQQPLQFEAEQVLEVCAAQTPSALQVWDALHALHVPPPWPQALEAVPLSHRPLASQQPPQVVAEQLAFGVPAQETMDIPTQATRRAPRRMNMGGLSTPGRCRFANRADRYGSGEATALAAATGSAESQLW